MTETELKLIAGALLHDVGKVIYRSEKKKDIRKSIGKKGNISHSELGYFFMKNSIGVEDEEILDSIRYHHARELKKAKLKEDKLAYIVYIADNIASFERKDNKRKRRGRFKATLPLESVFNILNGNAENKNYHPRELNENDEVNIPTNETEVYDKKFYDGVVEALTEQLNGLEKITDQYMNSLLSLMEKYLTYIPSSTSVKELPDISLYDHVKMTAAYSSCIYQYLQAEDAENYQEILLSGAGSFYRKNAFLMFSMDMSGIQQFIYTIHSKNALRMLRARSFYLEILMEHMIDEILAACHLSRANLVYSGGGHCYILLPNTVETKRKIQEQKAEFESFFLKEYDISLYISMNYVECSAMDLSNHSDGRYQEIFRQLQLGLEDQKLHKYTAEQILCLNGTETEEKETGQKNKKIAYLQKARKDDDTRECKVCKRSAKMSKVNEEDICELCNNLIIFSAGVLYGDFYAVAEKRQDSVALPLPGRKYLYSETKGTIKADDIVGKMGEEKSGIEKFISTQSMVENNPSLIRVYGKNKFYHGEGISTKLWVADHTIKGKTTEYYAEKSTGINRIAVIRVDVDNMSMAFIEGFPEQYITLSRTATFSRLISLYFKNFINYILKHGEYTLYGEKADKERKVTVVYSGGDDIFLVGSWDDALEALIDIQRKFKEFSVESLTLSAGVGFYGAKYPLSAAAYETGLLEHESKDYQGKNAITLLGNTYRWETFTEKVIKEKLYLIEEFFENNEERGSAFLYRLLELIRLMEEKDKINLARFAYTLARLEPDRNADERYKKAYAKFKRNMYDWVQKKKEREQLETAIYLYLYRHRKQESEKNGISE